MGQRICIYLRPIASALLQRELTLSLSFVMELIKSRSVSRIQDLSTDKVGLFEPDAVIKIIVLLFFFQVLLKSWKTNLHHVLFYPVQIDAEEVDNMIIKALELARFIRRGRRRGACPQITTDTTCMGVDPVARIDAVLDGARAVAGLALDVDARPRSESA